MKKRFKYEGQVSMRIELTNNDLKVQYINFCLNKHFGTYSFIISFLEF